MEIRKEIAIKTKVYEYYLIGSSLSEFAHRQSFHLLINTIGLYRGKLIVFYKGYKNTL